MIFDNLLDDALNAIICSKIHFDEL